MIVLVMVTLPLAVEHEVVVLISDLVPHERVVLVFLTNFALGFTFGVALGLVEVSLAERLVSGAHGPGQRVSSEDVELPERGGCPQTPGAGRCAGPPGATSEGTRAHARGRCPWKRRSTERRCRCSSSRSSRASRSCRRPASSAGCPMPSSSPPTPAAAWAARGSWVRSSVPCPGASIMMTTYTAQGGPGSIAFASKVPGPHPADRRGTGQRVHGAQPRLHGGDAGDRALHGLPAVLPRRHLRWRGVHPAEDRRRRAAPSSTSPAR